MRLQRRISTCRLDDGTLKRVPWLTPQAAVTGLDPTRRGDYVGGFTIIRPIGTITKDFPPVSRGGSNLVSQRPLESRIKGPETVRAAGINQQSCPPRKVVTGLACMREPQKVLDGVLRGLARRRQARWDRHLDVPVPAPRRACSTPLSIASRWCSRRGRFQLRECVETDAIEQCPWHDLKLYNEMQSLAMSRPGTPCLAPPPGAASSSCVTASRSLPNVGFSFFSGHWPPATDHLRSRFTRFQARCSAPRPFSSGWGGFEPALVAGMV
jgi:hypothetical protein